MEDVTRKKDLSSRIHDAKVKLIWAIIKFIIIIAILIIVFFPYKKAEVDGTVVLVNPVTLIYVGASYNEETKAIDGRIRGIATKMTEKSKDGKEEKYYVILYKSIKESSFEEKGEISLWQAIKMCWFI